MFVWKMNKSLILLVMFCFASIAHAQMVDDIDGDYRQALFYNPNKLSVCPRTRIGIVLFGEKYYMCGVKDYTRRDYTTKPLFTTDDYCQRAFTYPASDNQQKQIMIKVSGGHYNKILKHDPKPGEDVSILLITDGTITFFTCDLDKTKELSSMNEAEGEE